MSLSMLRLRSHADLINQVIDLHSSTLDYQVAVVVVVVVWAWRQELNCSRQAPGYFTYSVARLHRPQAIGVKLRAHEIDVVILYWKRRAHMVSES